MRTSAAVKPDKNKYYWPVPLNFHSPVWGEFERNQARSVARLPGRVNSGESGNPTMPYFDSDSVKLHYLDEGAGPPVVLIHSMASNIRHSWVETGWVESLRSSYRVVAMDCRGHGLSAKSDDPDFYTADRMADDVVRLLNHLDIGRALIAGYSMG